MTQVLEPEAEAARARFLARGECRHGHTLTAETVRVKRHQGDRWTAFCVECQNHYARAFYEKTRGQAGRDFHEGPPCLRCKLCQLCPQTDMSQARPVIFCRKFGMEKEMVFEGCAATSESDRTSHASEVEKAFVRARYASLGSEATGRLTRRERIGVRVMASRLGVACDPQTATRTARAAQDARNEASGHRLNAAQRAAYGRAEAEGRFPALGGRGQRVELRRAQREQLMAELRALGPLAGWNVVLNHRSNYSPAKPRARARSKKARAGA